MSEVTFANRDIMKIIAECNDLGTIENIIAYSSCLVFNAEGFGILHNTNYIDKIFNMIGSGNIENITLDFNGITRGPKNMIIEFLNKTTTIDRNVAISIFVKAMEADDKEIFKACITAIRNNNYLVVYNIFRQALEDLLDETADITDMTICEYFVAINNQLSHQETLDLLEFLIKSGKTSETMPVENDQCVLFGSWRKKESYEDLFRLACRYNNKSFIHHLMSSFKKYVTEDIVNQELKKCSDIMTNIAIIHAETK